MRYNASIRRIYCDHGSNLLKQNLFSQDSTLGVKNNLPYTQLRNVSESSTKGVKNMIREMTRVNGRLNLHVLRFVFEVVCFTHNTTPFITEANKGLIAPLDAIIPKVGVTADENLLWEGENSRMPEVTLILAL